MRISMLFSALVAACAAISARADIIVETTFNSNNQNWFTNFGSTASGWQSSGGNPGGNMRASDRTDFPPTGGPWYFQNGTTFNGNRSAAYGGTLDFDLRSNGNGSPKEITPSFGYDVLIRGTAGPTSIFLAYVNLAPPTGDAWTSYSLALNETSGWRYNTNFFSAPTNWGLATQAQVQSVLSNVNGIDIRGDYWTSYETTSLDNVSLNTAAVPEPTPLVLLGCIGIGLACCAAVYSWLRSRAGAESGSLSQPVSA